MKPVQGPVRFQQGGRKRCACGVEKVVREFWMRLVRQAPFEVRVLPHEIIAGR